MTESSVDIFDITCINILRHIYLILIVTAKANNFNFKLMFSVIIVKSQHTVMGTTC